MRGLKHRKALLVSLGLYLTVFAVSVNPPERSVQATEALLEDGDTLYLYFLGGWLHIGLGLDTLDANGQPEGMIFWDFGSRNHYSYKDEEWVSGNKDWFGSINNLTLLQGTTEGEMRSWDPTKRFGMTLDEFRRSSKIKVRIPITRTQWQILNDWLHEQTVTFDEHHSYPDHGLNIWFNGGVNYNLFTYNCATFIAQGMFKAGILTEDNVPKSLDQDGPVPSRWLFPPRLMKHYATHPLLTSEIIEHKIEMRREHHQCQERLQTLGRSLAGFVTGACALG